MSFDAARFAALSKKFGMPPATPKAVSVIATAPSPFPPTPSAAHPSSTTTLATAASPTSSPEKSSPVAPKRLGRSRVVGDTSTKKLGGFGVDSKENPPHTGLGVEEEVTITKPERLGAFQRSMLKLPRARLEEREEEVEGREEGEEGGAYSVSLTALKGSMRKMTRAAPQEEEEEEVVLEREEGGDYDYNDGWLVEDDIVEYEDGEREEEEEEEEEEEDDEEEGSSEEDEEEYHDGDHVGCGGSCTTSTAAITTSTTTAVSSDGGFELPSSSYLPLPLLPSLSTTPSFRVTMLPTPQKSKGHPPLEGKKSVSLQGIKDGAPHPRTGLVFIREEEGLPGDSGTSKASLSSSSSSSSSLSSRHTFRNKAARDALTCSLYAEYNTRVFGGRLPPMLTPPPPGAPPTALKAYTDKFEGGVGIPVEWRGRLIKTAGLTFMSTRRGGGGGGGAAACAARIALSTKVLDSPLKLAQTLLHEMCHAAQWVLDRVQRPPHGAAFQRWARAGTGAYPKRPVTVCHSYTIETKYHYQCSNGACGVVVGRHSKSIVSGKDGCKACGRGVMYEMGGGGGAGARAPATTSKYREFMERERAAVTRELGGGDPKEVMKELGRRWGIAKGGGGGGGGKQEVEVIDLTQQLESLGL